MPLPSELKPTPFHPFTPEDVEDYVDVLGFGVPVAIEDPEAEYHAIRNGVGLIEFSMLHKWDVRGPGALEVADSIFSRNLQPLPVGRIAYGAVTESDGSMVDDCTAFVYGPEHVRFFGGNPRVQELLEAAATSSVSVSERRAEFAVLSVQGPRSRDLLQRLTERDLSNEALPYYTFVTDVPLAGTTVQLNRLGFTAELGYEVMAPIDQAVQLYRSLLAAGQDLDVRGCGAAALMMCRVEAGMIMAELEYDATVSPFECRMGWAVDFDKAPWLGRDALRARKDADPGRVVSIRIDGPADLVDAATLIHQEEPVGRITMAVPSPELHGATLALARIDRSAAGIGTEVAVSADTGTFQGIVLSTPVYDPERKRVRS